MRMHLRAGVCVAVLAAASLAAAQTTDSDRLRRLEQRLDDMDRRYQQELKERDEEIARLKAQSNGQPAAPATAGSRDAGLLDEIDNAGKPTATDVAKTRGDIAADADHRATGGFSLSRSPASFNPDLAVITDSVGSYSTRRSNNALNRFDVREVEFDARAAVHPNADGVAIIAFARDVDNPPFPGEEEPTGPDASVNVEEAYLFLHDFGIPNLTAKLGRYHLRFGRQNILHAHDLPTVDPPLVNQAFLAPEALVDSGLSLSYVIPPKYVAGQYIELVGEVLAGEGAGSESPTIRGDVAVDSPAFNFHALWNRDLAPNVNLEIGASWLSAKADADNSHRVNLFGGDVTLIRTDPTGRFFNQLVQAEAIYGDTRNEAGEKQHAWGGYLLGQQQLNRDWYAGVRLDYTQNPNADNDETYAIEPYVSFYWSEFLRFRMQYQHKDGDVPAEDNVFFQATWIFGAHPPHPYWAMR